MGHRAKAARKDHQDEAAATNAVHSFAGGRASAFDFTLDVEDKHELIEDAVPVLPNQNRYVARPPPMKLGSGAFGRVILAYDVIKKQRVAIKERKEDIDLNPFAEFPGGGLDSEAHAMQVLQTCPHVTQILGTAKDYKDQTAIVMEYYPGGDLNSFAPAGPLRSWIPSEEQLWAQRQRALELMPQVADALHCMHNRGWILRDLKPENILLDAARENAFVADFGFAFQPNKWFWGLTGGAEKHDIDNGRNWLMLGTDGFKPPEAVGYFQSHNPVKSPIKKPLHSFDAWSLGATLAHVAGRDVGSRFFSPHKEFRVKWVEWARSECTQEKGCSEEMLQQLLRLLNVFEVLNRKTPSHRQSIDGEEMRRLMAMPLPCVPTQKIRCW
jgi:serine/threonine protein kinase